MLQGEGLHKSLQAKGLCHNMLTLLFHCLQLHGNILVSSHRNSLVISRLGIGFGVLRMDSEPRVQTDPSTNRQ